VLFSAFGLEQLQRRGIIDQMMHETPAIRPTTAAQLSLMAYQTDYGIYDHIHSPDPMRPLALGALHDKENTWEGGPIVSLIRRYQTYRIYEMGYSWDVFCDLPYPQAMIIIEMAEDTIRQRGSEVSQAEEKLRKQMLGDDKP